MILLIIYNLNNNSDYLLISDKNIYIILNSYTKVVNKIHT